MTEEEIYAFFLSVKQSDAREYVSDVRHFKETQTLALRGLATSWRPIEEVIYGGETYIGKDALGVLGLVWKYANGFRTGGMSTREATHLIPISALEFKP